MKRSEHRTHKADVTHPIVKQRTLGKHMTSLHVRLRVCVCVCMYVCLCVFACMCAYLCLQLLYAVYSH